MKLTRSFFYIYFSIVVSFVAVSWVLDESWSSYVEQDVESYTGYKFMLTAIGDYMQNYSEEEWATIVKNAGEKYDMPVALTSYEVAKKLLSNEQLETLKQGEAQVWYGDEKVQIFYSLNGSKHLITLGPSKMPTRPKLESSIRVLILAIFGVVVLVVLWPVSKDLDGLRIAAVKLSKGEFDTQAPKAKSNMMVSMVNTFNMMSDRIKRLISSHKELTNAVAHELRTPLARSKFALQMLETSTDVDKKNRYRRQIANDVSELEELINEMLLYASFDSEKPTLDIKEVDLSTLIKAHIANQDHYSGRISFTNFIEDKTVVCDSHFIIRAFTNYLTNAQKYGKDKINVSLADDKDSYKLIVEDNGGGIDEQLKSSLFDAFSRGEQSRNKEIKGFGLGLAIVERIMEWHQGCAWAENSESGGAQFYLKWPKKLST